MKSFINILAILGFSIFVASNNKDVFQPLEIALPSVLSAILGGILAAIAIIFAVLSTAKKKVKEKADKSLSYSKFVSNLNVDLKVLVVCLFFSIILPMLRADNFVLRFIEQYSVNAPTQYQYLISSLEIFILIVSFLVIYETVSVLITFLSKMMKL